MEQVSSARISRLLRRQAADFQVTKGDNTTPMQTRAEMNSMSTVFHWVPASSMHYCWPREDTCHHVANALGSDIA